MTRLLAPNSGSNTRRATLYELEREFANRVWGASQILNSTIQVTAVSLAPYSVGGTVSFASNGNSHWANHASAATTGSLAGRAMVIGSFQTLPSASVVIETGAVLTSQRIWVGVGYTNAGTASIANGTDDVSATGDFLGFRYSTSAGDTSWKAITSCAATLAQTTAPTGIAVAASTRYDFMFAYTSPTSMAMFIGAGADQPLAGPFEIVIPSGIVTTTTSFGVQAVLENTADAARDLRYGRFWFSRR